jgi:DNA mismatch repair protein MutL
MIAAGEVVEGPFSVVKELIENSIDAGAAEIDLEIFDSGLKKIVVKDNGSGISKSDIELSIREHATSKISEPSDLEKISTYGFRGEALSSIASISDLVILSRREDEDMGARLESGLNGVKVTDYAGSKGTTVIVENLFFTMPARKKFLKSKRVELKYIRDIFLKMSIPCYNISFNFDVDGKRQVLLPATDSADERIKQVFGRDILDNLCFEKINDLKVEISGYFSKPHYIKSSRNMQMLFVNNRPVEYRFLSYHLSRAYEAVIPRGKHAAAIVFLNIDPCLIDVNIHPAKREIKLFDQKYIDSLVFSLASKSLNRAHHISEDLFKNSGTFSHAAATGENNERQVLKYPDYAGEKEYYHDNSSLLNDPVELSGEDNLLPLFLRDVISVSKMVYRNTGDGIKIFGPVFNTYIMAQKDEELYVIDFHAAHERIVFDSLMNRGVFIETQELLFPVVIELARTEYSAALEMTDLFREFGFDVDDFSDSSIIVRSVPVVTGKDETEDTVRSIIETINEDKSCSDLKKKVAASLACHSAKRAGDKLSDADMKELVSEVLEGKTELRCPHGRPFLHKINKNDFEKIFKR